VRFYLLDRIHEVEPRQRIRALKLASNSDLVVEDHPTAGSVLAPVLIIESLAQTSAWLILASTDFAQRGVLAGLRHIEFGAPAPLGSRLDLTSEVDSWSDEAVVFNVEASHNGASVVRIEGALCFLIAAERLEDPEQTKAQYQQLRSEEEPAEPALRHSRPLASANMPRWVPYDAVGEVVPGAEGTALRSIVMTDPVFDTHFPRLAVVPGVLLMQSIVSLARQVLPPSCNCSTRWQLNAIHGARFQKYVCPGDELVLRVRVRDQSEGEAILSGVGEVGGAPAVTLRRLAFSQVRLDSSTCVR
jgi:3-hydroxyacyl-[acyl-carrier-protein] dehydratase